MGATISSNVRFDKSGNGYRLTCTQDDTDKQWAPGIGLEDGKYQVSITLLLDEDLNPLEGSFRGTGNQVQRIGMAEPYTRVASNNTYSGTFTITGAPSANDPYDWEGTIKTFEFQAKYKDRVTKVDKTETKSSADLTKQSKVEIKLIPK